MSLLVFFWFDTNQNFDRASQVKVPHMEIISKFLDGLLHLSSRGSEKTFFSKHLCLHVLSKKNVFHHHQY